MAGFGWEAERGIALLLLEILGSRKAEIWRLLLCSSGALLSHPLAFPLIPPSTQSVFSKQYPSSAENVFQFAAS